MPNGTAVEGWSAGSMTLDRPDLAGRCHSHKLNALKPYIDTFVSALIWLVNIDIQ